MNGSFLIVVGVDGSEAGRRALRWAADEAVARGGAVQAVTAWHWEPVVFGTTVSAIGPDRVDVETDAVRLIEEEIRDLVAEHGGQLSVSGSTVEGRPADVLTHAARTADLLVLGSHGHSRMHHTVLGSVSEECIRKANCPVVVIPALIGRPEHPAEPALLG